MIKKKKHFCLATTLFSTALLTASVFAVTTEQFVVDSAEDFAKGTVEGTAITSEGALQLGWNLARREIPDEQIIFSSAELPNGKLVLGSGTNGTVYKVENQKIIPWVKLPTTVISSLVANQKGEVFAGTLGEGKIYKISLDGKAKVWVSFKEKIHVWSLVYNTKTKTIFAGTGSSTAEIWQIADSKRENTQAKKIYQVEHAKHIMSLALDEQGTLYAGTSDGAELYQIKKGSKAEVVFDFEADEINAIDARLSHIAIAANKFEKPPLIKTPPIEQKNAGAKPQPSARPKAGQGQLWLISNNNRVEKIYENPKGHFTDVEITKDNHVFVAQASEGRVYRVSPSKQYAVWADVDERQVISLHISHETPSFVSSDGAAIYNIQKSSSTKGTWMSEILDAKFRAQWGALSWRGTGNLAFQTRSGNTETPNDAWSPWSKPFSLPSTIQSPTGRFLQIKTTLSSESKTSTELHALQAFYLPQNQRAIITNIREEVTGEKATQEKPRFSKKIIWNVNNPDGDTLRFKLRFKKEGQKIWRNLTQENEIVEEASYLWNTEGVPDGWYIISVKATDSTENPKESSLGFSANSEPMLVDHHAPQISKLGWKDGQLSGSVTDTTSPISSLQYAVDGKHWHPFFPVDQILDQKHESFSLNLSSLPSGAHWVSIRTKDAQNNLRSAEIEIQIP